MKSQKVRKLQPIGEVGSIYLNSNLKIENTKNIERVAISQAVDGIYNLPLKINDMPSLTVNDIRLERRMIKDLRLIVIDYLYIMIGNKKCENPNQKFSVICRDLKCLAGKSQVPILCLLQLNCVSDRKEFLPLAIYQTVERVNKHSIN